MAPLFYPHSLLVNRWVFTTFVAIYTCIVMKINPDYKLREIAGETIVVNQGTTGVDMTRIISLNASAKLLYEQLQGKEFTLEDAAQQLTDTYGIAADVALRDAARWVESLTQCGIIV